MNPELNTSRFVTTVALLGAVTGVLGGCNNDSDQPPLVDPLLPVSQTALTPISQVSAAAQGTRTEVIPGSGPPALDAEARFLVNTSPGGDLDSLWVCLPKTAESSVQTVVMALLPTRGGFVAVGESPARNLGWAFDAAELSLDIEGQAQAIRFSALSRTSETAFNADVFLGDAAIDSRGCYLADPNTARPLDDDDVTPLISDPVTAENALQRLFGQVDYTYRFVPSSTGTTYRDRVVFEPLDLRNDVSGARVLVGFDGSADYACLYLAPVDRFLCLRTLRPGQNIDVFLFALNTDGTGSGSYEYCLEGRDMAECGEAVAVSPDGTVEVTVTPAPSATTARSLDNSGPVYAADDAAYKVVDEQATPANGRPPAADPASIDGLVSRIESGLDALSGAHPSTR